MQVNRKFARYALIAIGALFAVAFLPLLQHLDSEHAAGAMMLASAPVALPDIKEVLEKIMTGFDSFKKTNDERLAKIEKGEVTGDLQAKLAAIQSEVAQAMAVKKDIEALETKLNIVGMLGGGEKGDPAKAAYKSAFMKDFVRKGVEHGEIRDLEAKAWSVGSQTDGGMTVPEEIDRTIEKLERDLSPMRGLANVVRVGTSDYKKLVNINGTASGWVGETDARPPTNTGQWKELTPFMGEIYANPQITQQMLDDSFLNVEQEIIDQLVEEFAIAEGAAFISGDGVKKPKGFLAYPNAATGDSLRAFGTLEYVATGASGALPGTNPADFLYTIMGKLKKAYRAGSRWTMPKDVLFALMKLKDSTGQYLWQPQLTSNGLDLSLLGFGVDEMEDMPAIAANSLSIAFGNFKRGYTIVDRIGMRMLRDPYTNKPYVGFYTTKRVGGFLVNSEAIKLGKFGAS